MGILPDENVHSKKLEILRTVINRHSGFYRWLMEEKQVVLEFISISELEAYEKEFLEFVN